MTSALFVSTVSQTLKGFILPFAEHFRSLGWKVDGMARGISACEKCRSSFDQVWDIDWSRNPMEPKNLMQAPGNICQVVRENRYDLVHVHTPVASFVTRYALRKHQGDVRPQVIYTAHGFHFYRGGNPLKNGLYLTLEKTAGRWTDFLVVMNREDYEAAKKYHIVPAERLTYMPGIGVDTAYYNSTLVAEDSARRLREELGLRAGDCLFLMVAEFIPRKRHEDVIRALARLSRPEAHLALAGTGPRMDDIRLLAAELKVTEKVHMLGYRRDIPALLKTSDALLLPSKHEGLPRSLMEALCLEVPCISSNIRGSSDLLDEGRGILVEVGDVEKMSEAMAWILDKPDQARAMAARGKASMADYDTRNIIRMHEELYRRALEN